MPARPRDSGLLARLGHECRTPLAAISSAADLLDGLTAIDDPLAREALGVIRRQVLALTCRIDEVVDSSRVIAGEATLARTRTDLAALAGQAVLAAQAAGWADHCDLRLTAAETPADLDAARVLRALSQLLAGALRGTAVGGEVEVEVGDDPRGPCLRLGPVPPALAHDPCLGFVDGLMGLHGGGREVEASPRGSRLALRFPLPAADGPAAERRVDDPLSLSTDAEAIRRALADR